MLNQMQYILISVSNTVFGYGCIHIDSNCSLDFSQPTDIIDKVWCQLVYDLTPIHHWMSTILDKPVVEKEVFSWQSGYYCIMMIIQGLRNGIEISFKFQLSTWKDD